MKAAVIKSPGVIEIEEYRKPVPGKGEVLLKVDACALCGTDQRVLRGEEKSDAVTNIKDIKSKIVSHENKVTKEVIVNPLKVILGRNNIIDTI